MSRVRCLFVLDLRIAHDRFRSSSDPSLNGETYTTLITWIGPQLRLLMIKYANIALTTTITLLIVCHLYLVLIVRLGGYIVNLSDFYSHRVIGKLTAFF